MKKQNEQNKSLQEKLGQHEFQIPDTGWQNMEAILDGRKPVPQPTKPPLRWWAPGGKWGLSTLLIFGATVGVMAVSIFTWQQVEMNTPEMPLSSFTIPMSEEPTTDEQAAETEAGMLAQNRAAGQEQVADDQAVSSTPGNNGLTGLENRQNASSQLATTNVNARKHKSGAASKESIDNKETQFTNKAKPAVVADPLLSSEEHTIADSKVVFEKGDMENSPAITDTEDFKKASALLEQSVLAEDEQSAEIGAMEQISVLEPSPLNAPKVTTLEKKIDPLKPKNRFDLGIKWGGDFRPGMNSHVFGLHFAYHFSEKWMVEVGVQYKERSFVNNEKIIASFSDTVYWPYRIETYNHKDSIRHLHFGELPIIIGYEVKPGLNLFAGGQITLTGNDAWMETHYRREEFGFGGSGGGFSSGGYLSPGIVRWSTGMIVGGHYRFSRNFGADLRYVQGLTDLTYDEYYGNTKNYLNSSVQLTLKWYWL